MKMQAKLVLVLMVSLCVTSPLAAAGPVRRVTHGYRAVQPAAVHQSAVKLDSGLVIVPFAVPVAVPVATVVQPSVLYSYRQYADAGSSATAATTPPSSKTPSVSASKFATDAAAVLTRHCASCHRSPSAQGNLALFDTGGALVGRLPRQAILEAIEQGRMPQPDTATRLTSEELELLRGWARPPKDLLY